MLYHMLFYITFYPLFIQNVKILNTRIETSELKLILLNLEFKTSETKN